MPRVRFVANYDWHPKPNVLIAYKAGHSGPVSQACADAARAAGKAVAVTFQPKRSADAAEPAQTTDRVFPAPADERRGG